MEEKQISKKDKKELSKLLEPGENGRPVRQKVDYTKFRRRGVYNRKILRSMLKHRLGSNKIRNAWHQLRAEGRV